jgi:multimeric flavodoxin WrbA
MEILAINGSYRKNGNTAQIIEMVSAQMQAIANEKGDYLEFNTLNLGRSELQFCRGCRACFDLGEQHCPLQDDLRTINKRMEAANGLILASPVYVNDVSGIIKNWIDRMAFLCHRPAFTGKPAFILTTVGLGPTRHAERTLSYALTSWGFTVVGEDGFKMGARMPKVQVKTQFQSRTEKIAGNLYLALQKPPIPSFLSLMTFRIQQEYWWHQSADESIDHQYWKTQGWTRPEQDYYISHQASKGKIALARLVGALLAPYVT